nr:MAK10-like protein [Tanacetum cinerariifolium]
DLLKKVTHHGIDLWFQVQIFYDHVNPATRRTIDQSAGGKLRDRNAKESWALLEDISLYDNESWNDPRDFAKLVKAISLPQDVLSTSDRHLIELENQVQRLMKAHLAPKQSIQVNKITFTYEICSGPHDTQYYMENLKKAFVDYASSRTNEAGGKWIVSNFVASQDARLFKFEADFKQQQGEMTNKVDMVLKAITDQITGALSTRDAEINPFKDVPVFRRMVEFLGALPINLKGNMWESEDLIENPIDWDKPPKNGDGAWLVKIRLIDPDGEKFNKTFQSIPTSRKLSEKDNIREIVDLDHFHET